MQDKTRTVSCQDWRFKSKGVFVDLRGLDVGLRETPYLEHLRHILSVDEDFGHEAIVDILAVGKPSLLSHSLDPQIQ